VSERLGRWQVHEEAFKLFSRHDGGGDSEWPNLRRDLADLAGPAPLRVKMRISKRMSRVRPQAHAPISHPRAADALQFESRW